MPAETTTNDTADPGPRLHRRASRVFAVAVRVDPADRGEYLEAACGDDETLRREVEALLAHDVDRGIVAYAVSRKALRMLASLLLPVKHT